MILKFKERYIKDISLAQIKSWQTAFKGILSKKVLNNLDVSDFEKNWKKILKNSDRENFIWLNKMNKAVGFVSFGEPKSNVEKADFEIYGIYVDPEYWGQKIGFELMNYAVNFIKNQNQNSSIILWTMKENKISIAFYIKYGFITNDEIKLSIRNGEEFEEIKFEITA